VTIIFDIPGNLPRNAAPPAGRSDRRAREEGPEQVSIIAELASRPVC